MRIDLINFEKWKKHIPDSYGYQHGQAGVPEKILLDCISNIPEDAKFILDLGCGNGWSTKKIEETGRKAVGVSIFEREVDFAKKEYGVNAILADMHDLPFPNNYFDLVFARDVWEHSMIPWISLSEMKRVTKKYIYIIMPGEGWTEHYAHWSVLTVRQMKSYFERAKLKILKHWKDSWNEENFLLIKNNNETVTISIELDKSIYEELKERNLILFAGNEPIAIQCNNKWYRKVSRCNMCGECCFNVGEDWYYGTKEDGSCNFLTKEKWEINNKVKEVFVCRAPLSPWECIIKRPGKLPYKKCTISYK